MSLDTPRCWERGCKHFEGVIQPTANDKVPGLPRGDGEDSEWTVCAAFPDGIPEVITTGENLHLVPFQGDHGIQFEPDPEREDRDTSDDTA